MLNRRRPRSCVSGAIGAAVFLLVMIASARHLRADADPFREGVASYDKGLYAEAEASFRKVRPVTSTVLYNIGNACFKQRRMGEAILAWEQALRLDPLCREARQNIDISSRLLRDAVPPDTRPLPVRWLSSLLFGLPLAWLRATAVVAWILTNAAILLLILWRPAPRFLRPLVLASIGITVLFAGLYGLNRYRLSTESYGVLLASEQAVRSGPGEQNTVLLQIHEGLKVKILNTQADWIAIKIPGGYTGWVPARTVGRI